MATWKETYIKLAIAFDATVSDVVEDHSHLIEARLAMIDLTTIEDGSLPGFGTEASVALLCEMDTLVRQSKLYFIYDDYRRNMVRSINDFTIAFYGDLDDFVNNLDWPDLCAPVFWAQLSEDGDTDTSNWIVCS